MNPLRKLAGQTLIYGMGTIVPRLLNYFLLTPFYTRVFLQEEYGIITELYAYMAFLLVLLTYGMETAFFRFAEKEPEPRRVFSTAFFSILATSSFFVLLVVLFNRPIATAIQYGSNPEYITLFSLIIALDAITAVPFAFLRKQDKALRFSVIKVASVLINVGLNFYFLWICPRIFTSNPDSWLLVFYDPGIGVGYAFIANLVASIITLLMLLPDLTRQRLVFDRSLLRRMLVYALPLLIVGLAGMINEVSDKIIFKYLVRVPEHIADADQYVMQQLGIYGASYKLAVLMTLFIQMFRYAAEPFFFAQAKESDAREVYSQVMKYFILSCLLIFLVVTLFIDIFQYFIGPDFREGIYIVPIVLLANLLMGVVFNLSMWYKLQDLTRYGAYIALTGAAVTILLNVLLVPKFSYLGAAWGHLGSYVVMTVISFFWGQRFYRIQYPLKRIGFYFLLAALMFLAGRYIPVENRILSWGLGVVLISIFAGVAFFLERRPAR